MNIQESPPEISPSPCPACGSPTATSIRERMHTLAAAPAFDQSALSLLESENSGLRRLLIDLIEKNQRLRDQLRSLKDARNPGTAADLRLVDSRIAS